MIIRSFDWERSSLMHNDASRHIYQTASPTLLSLPRLPLSPGYFSGLMTVVSMEGYTTPCWHRLDNNRYFFLT